MQIVTTKYKIDREKRKQHPKNTDEDKKST